MKFRQVEAIEVKPRFGRKRRSRDMAVWKRAGKAAVQLVISYTCC